MKAEMILNETPKQPDDEIYECLNLDHPKSFFLFAGAGSGKTRSLVEVLKRFREENVERLRLSGQRVGIITYTNAACDEIKRRLEFDLSFYVSTIHSFAWELISPYVDDIRNWLRNSLNDEIADLEDKQGKAKNQTTKTYIDRKTKIKIKEKRLENLEKIKKFTYNPNGDNTNKDSLNHTEVINIAAHFISSKPLMQSILVRKFPILLIDESQDTKKELIDAFFKVQNEFSNNFSLGMFGDTMQRIYTDGKENLGENIPEDWATPKKEKNYRCPKRVVTLINKIRKEADGQEQISVKDLEGIVRLFIVNTSQSIDKLAVESSVRSQMAEFTGDEKWSNERDVKILTLEHHMAAKRGGFSEFFDPLCKVDKLKMGLLDGSSSVVSLFMNQVFPLVKAKRERDKFLEAKIIRKYSPFFKSKKLEIIKASKAVKKLMNLWNNNNDPFLCDILKEIYSSNLLIVPDVLAPIAKRLIDNQNFLTKEDNDSEKGSVIYAWDSALKCQFSQFESYVQYISDQSRFGTHQGIKGLEFPRVMVILDDEEARGFLFSYGKLFGAKEPSDTDKKNQESGKETSIDRTRRLLYVTCSRTKESLVIVIFTNDPQKAKEFVLETKWFTENEICLIPNS